MCILKIYNFMDSLYQRKRGFKALTVKSSEASRRNNKPAFVIFMAADAAVIFVSA